MKKKQKSAILAMLLFSTFMVVWAINVQSQQTDEQKKKDPATSHPQKTEESTTNIEKNTPSNVQPDAFPITSFLQNHWNDILLTIFNGLLALFTYRLYRVTAGLWDAARKQSEDIKQSIAVAKETADTAKIEAETARQSIIMTHRPRIRVRNVVVRQPNPIHGVIPPLFAQGTYVTGQFDIANVGGTQAKIVETCCQVYWSDKGLPMERPYEGEGPQMPQPVQQNIILQAGEPYTALFQSAKLMNEKAPLIMQGSNNWRIYIMGWIVYEDAIGIKRRTAFCRVYRIADGRFFAVDDTDYEHEE